MAKAPALPVAPADLSPESQALWPGLCADVHQSMGGAQSDFLILADLLRARDRLAHVRAALERDGVTVSGSKGQTRPHPLLVTESVLRREVADGFRRLRLDGSERWRMTVDAAGRVKRNPGN